MIKKFTAKEIETINWVNRANDLASRVYYGLKEDKSKVVRNVKREGENKGQYGYYISSWAGQLMILCQRLKITNVVDLGCGAHILGTVLNQLGNKYVCRGGALTEINMDGYEIEDELIEDAKRYTYYNRVQKRDILKLTTADLEKYQAVYFWEPLANPKLAKKFVDNLEKVIPKGKYIFYVCDGAIGTYLDQSKRLKGVINNAYSRIKIYKS